LRCSYAQEKEIMSTELEASSPTANRALWIAETRDGICPLVDRLFAACYAHLLAAANRRFSAALRARLDPEDVVQETLLKAWQDFPHFRGQTEADLLAWLRQILRHNLANKRREHVRTALRSIRREVPLTEAASLPRPDSADNEAVSPGRQAQARERHEALEDALQRLPEHYRQVLRLRSREGLTFAQVGERLQCSAEAARKLWRRAANELARLLGDIWKS
jgi:RNA polymerase sigma-70 factor (ECF subfamily)